MGCCRRLLQWRGFCLVGLHDTAVLHTMPWTAHAEYVHGWSMAPALRGRAHCAAMACCTALQTWLAKEAMERHACRTTTAACYALSATVQLQAATSDETGHSVVHYTATLEACTAAVQSMAQHVPTTCCVQPWQCPLLHMHTALLAATAAASEAVLGPLQPTGTSPAVAAQAAAVVSACLHVLELAPAGTEALALRALSTLTRLDVLRVLRGAAQDAMDVLQDGALGTVVAWGVGAAGQVCAIAIKHGGYACWLAHASQPPVLSGPCPICPSCTASGDGAAGCASAEPGGPLAGSGAAGRHHRGQHSTVGVAVVCRWRCATASTNPQGGARAATDARLGRGQGLPTAAATQLDAVPSGWSRSPGWPGGKGIGC